MTTATLWQTETGQAGKTGEETEELSNRLEVDEDYLAAERSHGLLRQRGLRRHMKDLQDSNQAADQLLTLCDPTTDPVFLGTSMGRTKYWHDSMREKLDGQNLCKDTTVRSDRGHEDSTHRSEQKAVDFEKYKEKLQTELQKTARKDARIEAAARRSRMRIAAQPVLAAKSMTNIPSEWKGCDAGDPSSWVAWSAGEWLPSPPKLQPTEGIPDCPVKEISADEVKIDGECLIEQEGWCRMPQEAAHPNTQFVEEPDYIKFATPDIAVYESQESRHVPIFYWHKEQLEAAAAAGAAFDILHGPSPFGGFGDGPNSFREMHIDPEKSWDRATAAITQQAAQLQALEVDGIPLRPKDIEGGLDGVRYGYDALFPEFRRCQWKSVDGKPIMREPRLPDDETDMDMDAFYKTCIDSGLNDMEIVSKIRLYGASTNSTADTGVDVLQNYKIDADGLSHIQTDRDAKLQLAHPRLGETCSHPNGIPYRNHPKAVIKQVKTVCAAYPKGLKMRTVTDGGAIRKKRRKFNSWITRLDVARDVARAQTGKTADAARQVLREALVSAKEMSRGKFIDKMSTKGKPGDDSVNACLPDDRSRCKYAVFSKFLTMTDLLVSSGCPVDTIHDDFSAYYEMFALGEFDKWYSAMIISAGGSTQGLRCEFGISSLPDDLNRINFMMCDVIQARASKLMDNILENPSPWSSEIIDKCRLFMAVRLLVKGHSRGFEQFPWFDDNVAASLSPITARLRQIRYDTWAEFHWDVSLPKAATNYWAELKIWEPVVGFDIRARDRRWRLPQLKVETYCGNITEIIEEAMEHPDDLMLMESVVQVMGRLAHAAGPVPRIWRHFGGLLSLIQCQHYEMYVQANREMVHLFKAAQFEMINQAGTPLTPYALRPGADGFRVWSTATDAGRSTETFEGGGGGWFRLWKSKIVFFFMYEWPAAQVKVCNIGALEMVTEQVAADLQSAVQTAVYGPNERHYLLSLGDNQAVSDHILNSARASTTEMRFLAAQRASRDDDGVRMCSSKQLHREFNTPADRLAAGDISGFIRAMASVEPGAILVRLDVPAESTSLDKLIEWSAEINAHGTLHRPAATQAKSEVE